MHLSIEQAGLSEVKIVFKSSKITESYEVLYSKLNCDTGFTFQLQVYNYLLYNFGN